MGWRAFFEGLDLLGIERIREGCEQVFAVAHFGLPDDLGEDASDGEVETAAVVVGDPLCEAQEVWGERGLLIEYGKDGTDAPHVGLLKNGEDRSGHGSLADGDSDPVTRLEGVAPNLRDAVVEDISGSVIELDFCKKAAWPLEFERGFEVWPAGFLAGHEVRDDLAYAKIRGLDDKDFGNAVGACGVGHGRGGGMGFGEVAGCGLYVGAVVVL